MNKFVFIALLALVAAAAAQEFTADNEEIMDAHFGKNGTRMAIQGKTKNFTNPGTLIQGKKNFTKNILAKLPPFDISERRLRPLSRPIPINKTLVTRPNKTNRISPLMDIIRDGFRPFKSSEMSFFDDETEYLKAARDPVSYGDTKNKTKKNFTNPKGIHQVEDEEEFEFDEVDADEIEDHVTKNNTVRPLNKSKTVRPNKSEKTNKTNKTNKTGKINKIKGIFDEEEEEEFKTEYAYDEAIEDFVGRRKAMKLKNKTLKNKTNKTGKINNTKGVFDEEEEFDAEGIEDLVTKNRTHYNKTARPNKTHKVNKTQGFFDKVKSFFFGEEEQEEEFDAEEIEDFLSLKNKTGGVKPPKKNPTKKNTTKNHTKKK